MTDHKAEAEDKLNWLHIGGATDIERANGIAKAQVHATLALVDELRLANLIGYLPRTKESGQEDSQRARVRALIEKELGL